MKKLKIFKIGILNTAIAGVMIFSVVSCSASTSSDKSRIMFDGQQFNSKLALKKYMLDNDILDKVNKDDIRSWTIENNGVPVQLDNAQVVDLFKDAFITKKQGFLPKLSAHDFDDGLAINDKIPLTKNPNELIRIYKGINGRFFLSKDKALKSMIEVHRIYDFNNVYFMTQESLNAYIKEGNVINKTYGFKLDDYETQIKIIKYKNARGDVISSLPINIIGESLDKADPSINSLLNSASTSGYIDWGNSPNGKGTFKAFADFDEGDIDISKVSYVKINSTNKSRYVLDLKKDVQGELIGPHVIDSNVSPDSMLKKSSWSINNSFKYDGVNFQNNMNNLFFDSIVDIIYPKLKLVKGTDKATFKNFNNTTNLANIFLTKWKNTSFRNAYLPNSQPWYKDFKAKPKEILKEDDLPKEDEVKEALNKFIPVEKWVAVKIYGEGSSGINKAKIGDAIGAVMHELSQGKHSSLLSRLINSRSYLIDQMTQHNISTDIIGLINKSFDLVMKDINISIHKTFDKFFTKNTKEYDFSNLFNFDEDHNYGRDEHVFYDAMKSGILPDKRGEAPELVEMFLVVTYFFTNLSFQEELEGDIHEANKYAWNADANSYPEKITPKEMGKNPKFKFWYGTLNEALTNSTLGNRDDWRQKVLTKFSEGIESIKDSVMKIKKEVNGIYTPVQKYSDSSSQSGYGRTQPSNAERKKIESAYNLLLNFDVNKFMDEITKDLNNNKDKDNKKIGLSTAEIMKNLVIFIDDYYEAVGKIAGVVSELTNITKAIGDIVVKGTALIKSFGNVGKMIPYVAVALIAFDIFVGLLGSQKTDNTVYIHNKGEAQFFWNGGSHREHSFFGFSWSSNEKRIKDNSVINPIKVYSQSAPSGWYYDKKLYPTESALKRKIWSDIKNKKIAIQDVVPGANITLANKMTIINRANNDQEIYYAADGTLTEIDLNNKANKIGSVVESIKNNITKTNITFSGIGGNSVENVIKRVSENIEETWFTTIPKYNAKTGNYEKTPFLFPASKNHPLYYNGSFNTGATKRQEIDAKKYLAISKQTNEKLYKNTSIEEIIDIFKNKIISEIDISSKVITKFDLLRNLKASGNKTIIYDAINFNLIYSAISDSVKLNDSTTNLTHYLTDYYQVKSPTGEIKNFIDKTRARMWVTKNILKLKVETIKNQGKHYKFKSIYFNNLDDAIEFVLKNYSKGATNEITN